MSTAKQKMTVSAASALYNCGPAVVDYTRGVLDALGYDDLSGQLASAHNKLMAARQARGAAATPSGNDMLAQFGMTDAPEELEDAVKKAQFEFDSAWVGVDVIKEAAQEWTDERTGAG